MATLLLSFVLLLLIVAGMAIGVIMQGKPIKGSCGGINALGMGTACEICGGDVKKCEKETSKNARTAKSSDSVAGLAYDATQK